MTDTTTAEERDTQRRTWSAARRAAAERAREEREARRRAPVDLRKRDHELVAEAVVGEAVDNLKGIAALFVMPVAPYTALTITGVPAQGYEPEAGAWMEPLQPGRWVVVSRADMIGRALLPQAQRNARLLAVLDRINGALRSVEVLEATAAIAASAAVDARMVEPDLTVQLPGGIEYPVLSAVIGDTIEFVAAQQPAGGEQRQAKRQRRATENDEGVQEPGQPWPVTPDQAEPNEAQLAAAHALREARAAREAGTQRADGQVVIPGGVEDT